MRFIITTEQLNYLITKCANVIPAKPAIPILNNLLIEARDGQVVITATDLLVGIRCYAEAKVLEEGATTLPAKKFGQLVRELTAPNVEISTNANEVAEIVASSSKFKLNGMSRAEFPELPSLEEATKFEVKQADLKDMFFRTSFTVSKEDNRYALTGVFMNIKNGQAVFIGTDGKRLARAHIPIQIDQAFSGGYIIPIKAVEEMQKSIEDDGNASVYLMKDKIAIVTNRSTIVTKLLAGDYPDVSRVIPEQADTVLSLHREELISLLRQTALFTAEGSSSVRFTFAQGEVKLAANNMEVGEGKVSMPVNYHGPKIDIAFNPNFFLDILRHSKGETVTLGITDGYNPGVIIDQEGLKSISSGLTPLFILMPMRLSEE